MTYIRQLWQYIILIFVASSPATEKPVSKSVRDTTHAQDIEDAGRWYFKRDILDKIDEYFNLIGKMKKADKESYDLYSRVGAVIASTKSGVWSNTIKQCDGRVSFGAIFVPYKDKDEDEDKIFPQFQYFRKLSTPPATVQPTTGTVYEIVALYISEMKNKNYTFPAPCYVAVMPDRSINLLKELHTTTQKIRTKKPSNQRNGQSAIIQIKKAQWSIPRWLRDHSKENKHSPQETAEFLLGWAYNLYVEASKDVRIRCEKDNIVATFMVDLLRMPYFFADRETTVAVDGKKKRIFHIVRTHKRSFKSGGHTYVKSHFRGQRRFQWNGYGITISMPGKHHTDLLDATFGAHDCDAMEGSPHKMLTSRQVGKQLDDHMRRVA